MSASIASPVIAIIMAPTNNIKSKYLAVSFASTKIRRRKAIIYNMVNPLFFNEQIIIVFH